MNQSQEKEKEMSFIKKAGKWAPLVGGAWICLLYTSDAADE